MAAKNTYRVDLLPGALLHNGPVLPVPVDSIQPQRSDTHQKQLFLAYRRENSFRRLVCESGTGIVLLCDLEKKCNWWILCKNNESGIMNIVE